ncbi:MAG TPA: hypothetical protein DCZ12_04180 [Gammaproteobacteria bacterium]|nr:hypothetical protein [Gammaproteobacteria bacterium]
MTYNNRNRKSWSINANEAKRREMAKASGDISTLVDDDDHITIEITRKRTGENVVIELFPGSRIDSYRVYVDGESFRNPKTQSGERGISNVGQCIAKALPRFKALR